MKTKEEIMKEKEAERIISQNQNSKRETSGKKQTTVYLELSEYKEFQKKLPKSISPSDIFNIVMALYNEENQDLKNLIKEKMLANL